MHTGQWLREQRLKAGLSLEEANFRLRGLLPPTYWMATSSFHRLETKADLDPVIVMALAEVYGADPKSAPEVIVERAAGLRDLLIRSTG